MADLERVKLTFGASGLTRFLNRLKQRLERGLTLDGRITLTDPTDDEQQAIEKLLGKIYSGGKSISIDLNELNHVLIDSQMCSGLSEAVVLVSGPLSTHQKEMKRVNDRWSELNEEARRSFLEIPGFTHCWEKLELMSLLRRLSRSDPTLGHTLLTQTILLASTLPTERIFIAEFAAKTLGDSHALDLGRPLNTILLRLAAIQGNRKLIGGSENRRDLLASMGILCDDLSAPVLTLNLRAAGGSPSSEALELHAASGEPYWLTTRQLLRDSLVFSVDATGPEIFVCENPTVVAAAASELEEKCSPIISIDGQPKTAARLLLQKLCAAGIRLKYHGDFDWPGIKIGNLVMRRYGALPWRFSAEDYKTHSSGTTLSGPPVAATWDTSLQSEMVKSKRAIHEEQLLSELLCDLEI
jgi:uncharacterized protein (TIGR02679 family)